MTGRSLHRIRSRQGMTFIEILLVSALMFLFSVVLYQFWGTSRRYSTNLERRFSAIQEGQIAMRKLTTEIREATRLVFPAPGGGDQPSVSVVNGEGHTVMYVLEPGAGEGRLGLIVRHDLFDGSREVLLDGVQEILFRVPPVPPVREPSLVHASLFLDGPDHIPIPMITSIRLVPLSISCPMNR